MARGQNTADHPNRRVDRESVQTKVGIGGQPIVVQPQIGTSPEGHQYVDIEAPPIKTWNTMTLRRTPGGMVPEATMGGGPSGPMRRRMS
jgi:hypothetical protein